MAISKEEKNINKRKYPRYSPDNLIVSSIYLNGSCVVGEVIDISHGGFSIKYVKDIYEKDLEEDEVYTAELFSPHGNMSIGGIKCRSVYTKPLYWGVFTFLRIDRCGFMFVLSDEKKDEIITLINKGT